MELLKFIVNNVLGPVFDHDLVMVRARVDHDDDDDDGEEEDDDEEEEEEESERRDSERENESRRHKSVRRERASNVGDAILDPSGPKLIDGFQNWLLFYQFIGFINLSGVPLYLSIAYRLGAHLLANYIMSTHFVFKILFSNLLNINHANPIFILLTFLTLLVNAINILVISHTSTFNLRPLFKILDTPRLCRVNRHTQNALGANTLKYMLMFFIYHSVLYRMMVHENFGQFMRHFNLLEFLLEYYAATVYAYEIVGLAHVDFYVRSCFGAWLLALKTNLECRRARFRHLERSSQEQRRRRRRRRQANNEQLTSADHAHPASATPTAPAQARRKSIASQFRGAYLFVSLNDIQRSLNTIDDHLEVTRSIQTSSLVMLNLLAFAGCGVLFLISYDLMANANDFYHGIVLALVSLNYTFLVMPSYLGDSFIYYALGKLVQTVEDEYFLQEDGAGELERAVVGAADGTTGSSSIKENNIMDDEQTRRDSQSPSATTTVGTTINATHDMNGEQTLLTIHRSDVLFCHEFVVQFEDHLATAWSKLTVKSHLHMMGAFATIIAAQIIFDSH